MRRARAKASSLWKCSSWRDVELICEECRGTRFKSGVLEVRYRGKNIHEVLQLTVREALVFFAGVPKIKYPSCAFSMRSGWVICGSGNPRRPYPAARHSV